MCIEYRGTEYLYGLDVLFQGRHYHILMTDHREDRPYVYGGLCLDNGLRVNSAAQAKYVALYEIIKKVVDGTADIERAHAAGYPSQPFLPFKNILEEDADVRKNYGKRMSKAMSIDRYKNIRSKLTPLIKSHKFGSADIKNGLAKSATFRKLLAVCTYISMFSHMVPILYDCKDIVLTASMLQEEGRFDAKDIKYRRV